ncbi:hypothetical protein L1887_15035 [Cichorium endivia]|nr:hypothetical protein L1887_15035 [Cichorium endivia]
MDRRRRLANTRIGGSSILAIGSLLVATSSILMVVNGKRIPNPYDDQSSSCQFPAIFNFGDSNSDTGAVSAVFGRIRLPYGMTYFHKPSGRFSDGRLIIDFLAENLGLPYLSAYLDSIGTNFRHGANFAVSGATIQPADALMLNRTFNPLTLDVQLSQFQQFKDRSSELYREGSAKAKSSDINCHFPRPNEYTRALYTFDIGQNDLNGGIVSMKEEQVKKYIPTIIDEFSSVVRKLYQQGARTFWIHNTGPIGCLPYFVKNYPPTPENTDEIGCVKSYNDVAQEFNKNLKDKVSQMQTQLQEASLVYVDVYSVKYSLISQPNKYGFTDRFGQCIGQDGNFSKACVNPLEYISSDGVHYTETANKWIANRLQDGSFCAPKVPLAKACQTILGS